MSDKTRNEPGVPRSRAIREVLLDLQKTTGVAEIFLTSADGLVIAATPTADEDKIMALAALMVQMHRSAQQIQRQLGWPPVNKVTMRGAQEQRLVGYGFTAGGCDLMLGVLTTEPQFERAAVVQAIRAIQQIHKTCHSV